MTHCLTPGPLPCPRQAQRARRAEREAAAARPEGRPRLSPLIVPSPLLRPPRLRLVGSAKAPPPHPRAALCTGRACNLPAISPQSPRDLPGAAPPGAALRAVCSRPLLYLRSPTAPRSRRPSPSRPTRARPASTRKPWGHPRGSNIPSREMDLLWVCPARYLPTARRRSAPACLVFLRWKGRARRWARACPCWASMQGAGRSRRTASNPTTLLRDGLETTLLGWRWAGGVVRARAVVCGALCVRGRCSI